MKEVKVQISKTPNPDGVVAAKKTKLSKRLMEKIFGATSNLTVIAIGDSVEKVTIEDITKGDQANGKNETRRCSIKCM